MEIYSIKNDYLTVQVKSVGAEIISVKDNANNEFIWQADPEIWNRRAPVLFPIVGRLKGDHYYYNDHEYEMSQHGFARDEEFSLASQTDAKLVFSLVDSDRTLRVYPFHFKLRIVYQLVKDTLQISYLVDNTDAENDMYFAIGAHPGFSVPFEKGLEYEDFGIKVEPKQTRSRISLKDSNIDLSHEEKVEDQDFTLNHDKFADDAIIYRLNDPAVITIESAKTDRSLTLDTGNAKFVGIWSQYPETGNFVCIEPWWGIADKVDTDNKFESKYGINLLEPKQQFDAYYSISFK